MNAADLEKVLMARLVRERGGTSQAWQRALGKVIVCDMSRMLTAIGMLE